MLVLVGAGKRIEGSRTDGRKQQKERVEKKRKWTDWISKRPKLTCAICGVPCFFIGDP